MPGKIRLIIAGGGTGGHVFPMLAVARAVVEAAPGSEVLFIGTRRGIEARLVPEAGFPIKYLRIGGLKGKSIFNRVVTLAQLPWAGVVSAFTIAKFGPHVVLGGGGYASGPVGLAASFLRVPLALLEVNSLPGFTNRKLAKRAAVAFTAFEETGSRLACRTLVTGNPIRTEVRGEPHQAHDGPLRMLVVGGSQGAVGLNSLVIDALPGLKEMGASLEITHQAGKLDFERVRSAYGKAGIAARIEPFIEDMARAYREADFVVCRAGATTVAELVAARRPAMLVPLPTAADNHQEYNAKALVDAGGGLILRQNETDGRQLSQRIADWYDRRSDLPRMGAALEKLDRPGAAAGIAAELITLAEVSER